MRKTFAAPALVPQESLSKLTLQPQTSRVG